MTACCTDTWSKGERPPREYFMGTSLAEAIEFMKGYCQKLEIDRAALVLTLLGTGARLPPDLFTCLPFDSISVGAMGVDEDGLRYAMVDQEFPSGLRFLTLASNSRVDGVPAGAFKPPGLVSLVLKVNFDTKDCVLVNTWKGQQLVPLAAGDLNPEAKLIIKYRDYDLGITPEQRAKIRALPRV